MFRAVPLGCLCLLSLRSLLAQAVPSSQPEPALLEVQALLDAGKLSDAESADRRYLETHAGSADGHYLLGYILFREAKPKLSLAEYTEGARYRPPAALDLEVIGNDYFLLEDYPAADKWLTKAVESDPADALARFYLGRAKFNEKHFVEAISAFAECLKLQPANVQAADNLGLSYAALGKTEDALKAHRAAVASDAGASTHDPGPYLNLGTLLADNERPAEAVAYLSQAVQMLPSDPRAHRELGKTYLKLNRLEDARTELEKAVQLAPENAPNHFLLSRVLRKAGFNDRANIENDRYMALTGAHSSPDTPLQEIRALIELGKLHEAEQLTRRYLEVHKNSGDAHYLLGYVLFKEEDAKSSLAEYTEGAKYRTPSAEDLEVVAGDYVLLKDYPDADKWFTKAVEWNPNDALGWYYLGRTKYNENRFDEAVAAFQKCLQLDPRNVKAEDNLGLSYEGLNRIDDAAAAYHIAIDWQANSTIKNAGPFLDLGSLMVDNDRATDALPYLLEAARFSAEDYRVHRQLGKTYAHLNQLEKARAEFEQAVQLAPANAPIHFMLAQVYRRQGLMDKAKAETERYSKLAETNPSGDK
jgi:tetratricopeptide (TPR) repeat protein